MAKFIFRFETVLKVRKSREDETMRALGVAQRAHQANLSRKGELFAELERSLIRRENLAERPTSIEAFLLEQSHIDGTKQRIVQCEQAIMRSNKAVEKALRAFIAARKQTRMMETLKEKDFAL